MGGAQNLEAMAKLSSVPPKFPFSGAENRSSGVHLFIIMSTQREFIDQIYKFTMQHENSFHR